jgi:ferrochelatase
LELVGKHYFDRGGISPINGHCRTLLADIQAAFTAAGIDLPLYWGNRNAPPFLDDVVAEMAADGIKHAVAFVTSAYSSYSGCRQYRENIEAARQVVGATAPVIDKLRVFFNHPGFIEPTGDALAETLASHDPRTTHVFFTAHSIPTASAATCDYEDQIRDAAQLVIDHVVSVSGQSAEPTWSLAWQSRSGPPSMPWLEPDISDAIRESHATDQAQTAIVVPIGFISDHMEVLQDLDTDAAATAAGLDMGFGRVSTPLGDERFTSMIVSLVQEKVAGETPVALGGFGLVPTQCSSTCCPAAKRPARP